jgi:hypothetical protein
MWGGGPGLMSPGRSPVRDRPCLITFLFGLVGFEPRVRAGSCRAVLKS